MTPNDIGILAFVGTFVTAVITLIVAKTNARNDRQQFYESKIFEIMASQTKEIHALKVEIEKLSRENQQLKLEIIALTKQMGGKCNEQDPEESIG